LRLQYQLERQDEKENVKMDLVNGPIQTKQHMKGIGLIQKKMVKEKKLGLMDIFTKVNLKIVSGVVKEF
jgi:hypothetical protein